MTARTNPRLRPLDRRRRPLRALLLAGLLVLGAGIAVARARADGSDIHPEALARSLDAAVEAFEAETVRRGPRRRGTTVFAAELLPANCHRGEDLLKPTALAGV
ncbi:MAG: hypothetical protein ACC662_00450, partial [Planctomycetota bacterium]